VGGKRKKEEHLRKHVMTWTEKGIERQPSLRSREFQESFMKTVG